METSSSSPSPASRSARSTPWRPSASCSCGRRRTRSTSRRASSWCCRRSPWCCSSSSSGSRSSPPCWPPYSSRRCCWASASRKLLVTAPAQDGRAPAGHRHHRAQPAHPLLAPAVLDPAGPAVPGHSSRASRSGSGTTIVLSLEEIWRTSRSPPSSSARSSSSSPAPSSGWAMQAVAQNRTLASVLGINVSRLVTLTVRAERRAHCGGRHPDRRRSTW